VPATAAGAIGTGQGSARRSPLPESEWLSVQAITEQLE